MPTEHYSACRQSITLHADGALLCMPTEHHSACRRSITVAPTARKRHRKGYFTKRLFHLIPILASILGLREAFQIPIPKSHDGLRYSVISKKQLFHLFHLIPIPKSHDGLRYSGISKNSCFIRSPSSFQSSDILLLSSANSCGIPAEMRFPCAHWNAIPWRKVPEARRAPGKAPRQNPGRCPGRNRGRISGPGKAPESWEKRPPA